MKPKLCLAHRIPAPQHRQLAFSHATTGIPLPTALQSVEAANVGVTLEDDGIRIGSRVELQQ